MRVVLSAIFFLVGCAAKHMAPQAIAYEQAPAGSIAGDVWKGQAASSSAGPASYSSGKKGSFNYQQQSRPQEPQQTKRKHKPMVVYQGYLKLRVKRLIEAADAITAITEKAGGYVESLTARAVVVRIPAGDFDAIMNELAGVGRQLDRRVKALDVTAQYTDLQGRLAVAERTRDRLLKLLQETKKPEERLRILQEIKRLTEVIESMRSTLASLKNLVDFFTITIELEPVMEEGTAQVHRSPFPWVRELAPHRASIEAGKDDVTLELPGGFVLFDQDEAYRAQAADTTILRAGSVDNEPLGDNTFWADAIDHELTGRDEELVQDGSAGNLTYRVYRNPDLQPRYYLVGVLAVEDTLFVVEVFYPNQDAFDRHHKTMVQALATFAVH